MFTLLKSMIMLFLSGAFATVYPLIGYERSDNNALIVTVCLDAKTTHEVLCCHLKDAKSQQVDFKKTWSSNIACKWYKNIRSTNPLEVLSGVLMRYDIGDDCYRAFLSGVQDEDLKNNEMISQIITTLTRFSGILSNARQIIQNTNYPMMPLAMLPSVPDDMVPLLTGAAILENQSGILKKGLSTLKNLLNGSGNDKQADAAQKSGASPTTESLTCEEDWVELGRTSTPDSERYEEDDAWAEDEDGPDFIKIIHTVEKDEAVINNLIDEIKNPECEIIYFIGPIRGFHASRIYQALLEKEKAALEKLNLARVTALTFQDMARMFFLKKEQEGDFLSESDKLIFQISKCTQEESENKIKNTSKFMSTLANVDCSKLPKHLILPYMFSETEIGVVNAFYALAKKVSRGYDSQDPHVQKLQKHISEMVIERASSHYDISSSPQEQDRNLIREEHRRSQRFMPKNDPLGLANLDDIEIDNRKSIRKVIKKPTVTVDAPEGLKKSQNNDTNSIENS